VRTLVLLYVEHGETTDPITKMIDDAFFVKGAQVENYHLMVDVDEPTTEKIQALFPY
jgi:hypothetical protein